MMAGVASTSTEWLILFSPKASIVLFWRSVLSITLFIWVILIFAMIKLTVKYFVQIYTTLLSDSIGITHTCQSVDSSLHHIVRVGRSERLSQYVLDTCRL